MRLLRLALVSVALCALACSSDPTSSPASADGGTPSGDGGAAAQANVSIEYAAKRAVVDVASLPRQDYKGSQVVSLANVWNAAQLGGDLAKLEFDFEGDDGFRPSARDRCKALISGTEIAQGYILPETRTLLWDDALGLPGCYSVKLVAKVLVTDKP